MKHAVNPLISAAELIQKHFNFISKRNEKRIERMCQKLFTGRVVQNVVEIILLSFFPAITPKYVNQLSEMTLFIISF